MTVCDWPIDRSCLPALPDPDESDSTYDVELATQQAAENLAVQVMWALSGRQFGICEFVARPCPHPSPYWYTSSAISYSPFVVVYDGGRWYNCPCGCIGGCNIVNPRTVHLPGPVSEIVTVTIGGEVMAPEGYTLEGDVLYRRSADWPAQDLSLPLGSTGTWSVDYLRGQPVPAGVDRLTGLLAKEFLGACTGDSRCRLPRNVTRVSRQGISYEVFNPLGIYEARKTGLPEVDMWLASVNPGRLLSPPQVI